MQTTQNQNSAVNTEIFSCRDTFFTNVTCDEGTLMTCTKIQQTARQCRDSKLRVLIGTQLST